MVRWNARHCEEQRFASKFGETLDGLAETLLNYFLVCFWARN